jgi:hypothetical protein
MFAFSFQQKNKRLANPARRSNATTRRSASVVWDDERDFDPRFVAFGK